MSRATSLAELFSFEASFEKAFQNILQAAQIETVYITRETAEFISPCASVKVINGSVNQKHQYCPSGAAPIYDSFDASLEVEVRTQRISNGDEHAIICGKVRAELLLFSLLTSFPKTDASNFHSITDIREQKGDTSFDSDTNLDLTIIPHYLLINIRPGAWPIGVGN